MFNATKPCRFMSPDQFAQPCCLDLELVRVLPLGRFSILYLDFFIQVKLQTLCCTRNQGRVNLSILERSS